MHPMTWLKDVAAIAEACHSVASPGLLVRPPQVRSNIEHMIALAGTPDRLRPHLKTTKSPEVVRLLIEHGLHAFKCATLSELSMALNAGAMDVLLAYQPVGPQIETLGKLVSQHRKAQISVLVDCSAAATALQQYCQSLGLSIGVYIDIDCGMHRTGILPGGPAAVLRETLVNSEPLRFLGWHVYDGHLRQTDLDERRAAVATSFQPFWDWFEGLGVAGEDEVIAGGTPSFPIHAEDERVICSPGTCVYWDAGYASLCPDMDFDFAALLLTRVVSKGKDRLTLDLGHKAVGAENPLDRRVVLPQLPNARYLGQSEEHLVIETSESDRWEIGAPLIGIPWHVCPTVALYDHATLIDGHRVVGRWDIPARRREVG